MKMVIADPKIKLQKHWQDFLSFVKTRNLQETSNQVNKENKSGESS